MERIMRQMLPEIMKKFLKNPQKFSFHQALRIIENNWLKTDLLKPNIPLKLFPAAEMSFPPADIRYARMDAHGIVSLELNFMGLYGVDSALPLYFSQLVNQDNETAKRIKKFLNIINHRIYIYYYLAWSFQNYLIRFEKKDYVFIDYLLNLIGKDVIRKNPEMLKYFGLILFKKFSVSKLKMFLADYLENENIEITEFFPSQITIMEKNGLGQKTFLGQNILLGKNYFLIDKGIVIKIKYTTACDIFSNFSSEDGKLLGKYMKIFLPTGMFAIFEINFGIAEKHKFILGEKKSILNWTTVIGQPYEQYCRKINSRNLL